MSIPAVTVPIRADTSGLDSGLASAEGRLRSFAAGLMTPLGAAKALGAAVGAVTVGLIALTKSSLSNIDNMTKQARTLGLTAKALQSMSLVAEEAAVSAGQLSSMLGLMQRNITELGRGSAAQVKAFEALGISIGDLEGLSADQQFQKIASALNNMTDPAARTAAAMDVFGRSGRAAINMLDGYAAKVEDAANFQERFGIAVDQTDAEQIESANDALGRMWSVLTGIGNVLAAKVAPILKGFADTVIFLADKALPDFRGEIGTVERSQYELNKAIEAFNLLQSPEMLTAIKDKAAALRELAQANLDAAQAEYEYIQSQMDAAAESGTLDPEMYSILGEKKIQLNKQIAESLLAIADAQNKLNEAQAGGAGLSNGGTTTPPGAPDDTKDLPKTDDKTKTPPKTPGFDFTSPLIDRLDAEQERMKLAIQDEKDFWSASADVARQGGGKVGKAIQAVLATRALMNAWTAYTEVLADPAYVGRPWARFAAGAQVLAAGLGAVNAIKSASSGGSAGSAATSAGGAIAAAPTSNVSVQLVGGDMFSRDQVIGLINRINEAQEDGAVVRLV
jgi:hypothetical protein